MEAMMVEPDTGEQWSPNTHPEKVAPLVIVRSGKSPSL